MSTEPFDTELDSLDEPGPHAAQDELDARDDLPADERDEGSHGEAVTPTPQVADVPPTGERRVDEAVAILATLDHLPTAEHADVYEDVHRRLHTALTELDTD